MQTTVSFQRSVGAPDSHSQNSGYENSIHKPERFAKVSFSVDFEAARLGERGCQVGQLVGSKELLRKDLAAGLSTLDCCPLHAIWNPQHQQNSQRA